MKIHCTRHIDSIYKCGCSCCRVRKEIMGHKDALFKLELQSLKDLGMTEEEIGSIKDPNSLRSRIAYRIYK